MILTPLQALTLVGLIVLLCGAAMILIHRHMPLSNRTLKDLRGANLWLAEQNGQSQARIERLEQTQGITRQNLNLPADDDVMALWDAIVNDARKHEKDH